MREEFGLKPSGSIDCQFTFTRAMKELCGQPYTSGSKRVILSSGESVIISKDMYKPVTVLEDVYAPRE